MWWAPLDDPDFEICVALVRGQVMLGWLKRRHREKVANAVTDALSGALGFERAMNAGIVPYGLRTDSYVLGYHFMMATKIYKEVSSGEDLEGLGRVLSAAMSRCLDCPSVLLASKLHPLMESPDEQFSTGMAHAMEDFEEFQVDKASMPFRRFREWIREKRQHQ